MSVEILLLGVLIGITLLGYMIAINSHGPTRLSTSLLIATVILVGTVWAIIQHANYGDSQTIEQEFYTTTDLNDVPSDNLWESVVEDLLDQFTGITYTVDIENNIFNIAGDCEGSSDPMRGVFVELKIEIDLDVICDGRVAPPRTPTPTPSITSTPSLTPSITATVTVTPTVTPSITTTPSITPTVTTTSSITPTMTATPTVTSTLTPTSTVTPSVSSTPGVTPTPTPSVTSTNSVTPTVTTTPTQTVTPTVTTTPTQTVTPTVTTTPTQTVTPTPTTSGIPLSCELVVEGSGMEISYPINL